MQEQEFEKIIDQYLQDRLSTEQKSKVEAWLREMANDSAFEKLTEVERAGLGQKIYKQLVYRINNTSPIVALSQIKLVRSLLKLAAGILVFGTGVFFFQTSIKKAFKIGEYVSVNNSNNKIIKNILPDGSIVWLKNNSKLIYPIKFIGNTRKVELVGEALFEVAKDASHPFIIRSGTLTTSVLGTSFNIKHTNNRIEVNVLTGRVFLSSTDAPAIILHPKQKAVYDELKKNIVKDTKPVLYIDSLTAGTEYNMNFNETRVGSVLRQVEKKFDVSILVKSQQIKNELITVDITDKSLVNTLSIMSEALNLQYKINGQEVILTDKI